MIRAGQEFLWYICALHLFDTNFICVASEPQVQVKSVKFAGTTGITESASNQKNSTQLNSTLWKETPLEGRVPSKLWLLQGLPFRSDRNHHEIHTAKAVRPLNPSFPGGMISSQLPSIITKHHRQAKCHQDPSPRRTIGRCKFINPLGEVQQPLLDGTMQQVALRI